VSVVDLITIQQKKKENIRKNLKLENIANGAINTQLIKNLNFNGLLPFLLNLSKVGSNERA
jgi:hypothetical protein